MGLPSLRFALCAASCGVALLAGGSARADDADSELGDHVEGSDRIDEARAAFREGTALAQKMLWGEALARFEASEALRSHASTRYNIAMCQRALGQYTRAERSFRRALAQHEAGDDLSASTVDDIEALLVEIEGVLAVLDITLAPATAAVAIDGRPLEVVEGATLVAGTRAAGPGEAPPAARFRVVLDPGSHVIVLSREGFADAVVRESLAPGARRALTLRLERLPATLRVRASEPDATVSLDGLDVGVTPITLRRPAGSYEVVVRKPGFDPYQADVRLDPAQRADLMARLTPEAFGLHERWWFWSSIAATIGTTVVVTYARARAAAARRRRSRLERAHPMRRLAASVGLAVLGCAGELPPRGEAIVVVDTDLPVPEVVSRLRIDLYDGAGRWFASRDLARPDPRDWPVSFSLYSERSHDGAWLRLRLYPEARVRAYRGERFADWGEPLDGPAAPGDAPRLVVDGHDLTPASEPQPLVAIDRLVRVALREGERGYLPVVLHAACAGTMARLSEGGFAPDDSAASCVDREKERSAVVPRALQAEPPDVSEVDALAPVACAGDDERACVPGGATILGSMELVLVPDLEATPERIVIHRAFLADRDEVTVGRFRAALEAGFVPPAMPAENDGLLGTLPNEGACTFSTSPLDREDWPLSCVSWHTARAFCFHVGGDLPTEAQWEHMATRSGDAGRSRFAWGDEPPSCDRAIYGRAHLGGAPGVCAGLGLGPAHPASAPGDRTVDGVGGLAGGLQEWTLDSYLAYDSPCWAASPVHDPLCEAGGDERIIRGGAWPAPPTYLPSAVRTGVAAAGRASFIGFRCVYPR
jgi:formylglycine-generating enzyme required for sulfatase activity